MMSQTGTKSKKRTRRKGGLGVACLVLAVLATLALLAYRSGLFETGFSGALAVYGSEPFSLGEGRAVLCAFNGGVAACSNGGPVLIDKTGKVAARADYLLEDPAVSAGEKACVLWDGGTPRAWISSQKSTLVPVLAEGNILFASAGPDSVLLLTEDDEYRSTVTVYDTGGKKLFSWSSARATVLAARLSPDGRSIAAVSFADKTWTLQIYEIRTGLLTAKHSVDRTQAGGYFDVAWLSKDSLCAISAAGAEFFDGNLNPVGNFDFDGNKLLTYDVDDFALIALRGSEDGPVFTVSLDRSGDVLGYLETEDAPLSLDLREGKALILNDGNLTLCGKDLKQLGRLDGSELDRAVLVSGTIVLGSAGTWGRYLAF